MNQEKLKKMIQTEVVLAVGEITGKKLIPAAVSNRHAHLSRQDIDVLFGQGYQLTPLRELSQPGQFAAKETITLVGEKGEIAGIRVLGPAREQSQVELSVTDTFRVGIKPEVRMSGNLQGSPGGIIKTDKASVTLNEGVIVSARHIHLSNQQAADLGVRDGQRVDLKSTGERAIVLENTLVRSGEGHDFEVHLDMDEANAALIQNGDLLEIINNPAQAANPMPNDGINNVYVNNPKFIEDEPLYFTKERLRGKDRLPDGDYIARERAQDRVHAIANNENIETMDETRLFIRQRIQDRLHRQEPSRFREHSPINLRENRDYLGVGRRDRVLNDPRYAGQRQERGRALITEDDVKDANAKGEGVIYCEASTIITPLANDTARDLDIRIEVKNN